MSKPEFKGTKSDLEVYNNGSYLEVKVVGNNVGTICNLIFTGNESCTVKTEEETEANAILFSKANKLLEASGGLSDAVSEGNADALHHWNLQVKMIIHSIKKEV